MILNMSLKTITCHSVCISKTRIQWKEIAFTHFLVLRREGHAKVFMFYVVFLTLENCMCFSRWGKFLLQISERHLLRRTYFQSNMTIADTSSSNTKLFIWDKVFKNGSSKICTLTGHTTSNFSKAVFCKFYLVHCWILCLI